MKRKSMRNIFGLALAAAVSLGTAGSALAQSYPSQDIRLVCAFPPGSGADVLVRYFADKLKPIVKGTVIVENKAGAGGVLGSVSVATAAADGYTLLLGNNASQGTFEQLNPSSTPYRTLTDFAPVALVGVSPLVMVGGPQLQAKSIHEYIALAKASPGKLNYASASLGSAPHLASELLNIVAGIKVEHIPYNGTTPAIQALVSGTVDTYMGGVSSVIAQVDGGKAKIIGAVSERRISALPDVPTLKEQGVDVAFDSWYGLMAPTSVPVAILDKINADVRKVLDGDATKAELEKLGFERQLGTRDEFAAMLKNEIARIGRIIKDAKIEVK
jgi:tripartite-type tricarboxylate transporter receptor subunit TctC